METLAYTFPHFLRPPPPPGNEKYPFCTRVPLSVSVFTAAVWCVPALRVPLVHSLINHFRQKYTMIRAVGEDASALPAGHISRCE